MISSAKILESKLLLLLKPDFTERDKLDKDVFNAINNLKCALHSPQGRHGVINEGTLNIYSEDLLKTTKYLLKNEWNRIKTLEKT